MNEELLKEIPEYIKKLPKAIQEIVIDWPWDERVKEIAQKYSLNQTQTDDLYEAVLFVLIGIDDPQKLNRGIKEKLNISDILSDQILEELDKRIFEYATKELEKKLMKEKIPEIRPENFPEIEDAKIVKSEKTKIPKNDIPTYVPKPQIVIDREPVQTPVSVPRFKAVPLADNEIGSDFIPKLTPKPFAGGIMESKLNNVTPGIAEVKKETPPIVKNYSVDPYREPLN